MSKNLDDDVLKEIKLEQLRVRDATDVLEDLFHYRELMFSVPFTGMCPVQAFGHLDGKRFYYRSRGGSTTLRVGPADEEIDKLYALRVNEDKAERKRREEAAGFFDAWHSFDEKPQKANDPHYYPQRVTDFASATDEELKKALKHRKKGQAEEVIIFSHLLGLLKPVVGEDEQLGGEYSRVWLREGREAANALKKTSN